jgi:hypothetical protein
MAYVKKILPYMHLSKFAACMTSEVGGVVCARLLSFVLYFQKHLRLPLLPLSSTPAGLTPQDVDIVVTSASIFCPTPSLASMLINKLKMRSDVQSYNLGGMGCSNGVVGVALIRDLLQVRIGM